eukprot:scaffold135609_cov33-Attheya_sp.AAC.1
MNAKKKTSFTNTVLTGLSGSWKCSTDEKSVKISQEDSTKKREINATTVPRLSKKHNAPRRELGQDDGKARKKDQNPAQKTNFKELARRENRRKRQKDQLHPPRTDFRGMVGSDRGHGSHLQRPKSVCMKWKPQTRSSPTAQHPNSTCRQCRWPA